jgi:poly(hydroxyalkanoate) depolymerase family esterase
LNHASHPILASLLERTARILQGHGISARPHASSPVQDRRDVIDIVARLVPGDSAVAGQASSFTAGAYTHAYGKRDYKLFVPGRVGSDITKPALVVMLHGCTQQPDDFAAGTRMNEAAHKHGFLVLYPAQCSTANPQRCWNWFKHNHQSKGRGEPALLADMTRHIAEEHSVDPKQIYVAGLSAGGAMAAILGCEYPELFSAVGVHSGLAPGAANDLPSALAAMKSGPTNGHGSRLSVPTIIIHGDRDTTVHPANAEHFLQSEANVIRDETRAGQDTAAFNRSIARDADGRIHKELWMIKGAGHAWSGGSPSGSYTHPSGPDATAAMVAFFQRQSVISPVPD